MTCDFLLGREAWLGQWGGGGWGPATRRRGTIWCSACLSFPQKLVWLETVDDVNQSDNTGNVCLRPMLHGKDILYTFCID